MAGFPKRYVVLDTETQSAKDPNVRDTVNLTFRLGAAIVVDPTSWPERSEHIWEFDTTADFHDRLAGLKHDKEPIYVFAHNMGFDARIMGFFRCLALGRYSLLPMDGTNGKGRFKQPLFIAESPPFIVRLFRPDGQTIVLLDTYQWVQKSLAAIGEILGVCKEKMPTEDASLKEWRDYCLNDVVVTHELLKRIWGFLRSARFPDFMATPASQAMTCYRMRYEKKRIIRPTDPDSLKLDRVGYFGGMVECFRVGHFDGPIYQVDVNSLYAAVMSKNLFPCEAIEINGVAQQTKPWTGFYPNCATAEVYLDSAANAYPVRGHEETLYCRGKVRTVLCGPELERALSAGDVAFVGRHIIYRLDDLFTKYVQYWWRMRREAVDASDGIGDHIAKIMLASLHGKFGQRVGDWQYHGQQFPRNHFGHGKVIGEGIGDDTAFRTIGGHYYQRTLDQEDPRGFTPIASWTSSHARVFMQDVRQLAGDQHTLYQATDSLLVTQAGYDRLRDAGIVDTRRLGDFRTQEVYEWVRIHGIHQIDHSAGRKRAGIRANAIDLGSENYQMEEWSRSMVDLCQGNVSSASITTITRHVNLGYRRREIMSQGPTRPWAIDNWDTPPEEQRRLPIRH